MNIILDLPDPEMRIEAEGIVVRCIAEDSHGDTFRVAILYTKLSKKDQQAIKDYVEADLAQSS